MNRPVTARGDDRTIVRLPKEVNYWALLVNVPNTQPSWPFREILYQ
jgi:hypothetical protein